MVRATFWLVVLAAAAAAIAWLADHPGSLTLYWRDYRIDTSVAVLAGAVALASALAAALYQLWRWLRRAPAAVARRRRESRRLKGYRALTQGMVAVAAGDPTEARRQARRADVLLNEPPLTMLLSAQAAQLNGDEAAAANYFSAMLERPETEFLGLRGLVVQASKTGDTARALALARRAKALSPRTSWVLSTLFELEARAGQWSSAEETARLALAAGTMRAAQGTRNRAIALYQQSLAAEAAGETAAALKAARKANAIEPGFVPAAVETAKLLMLQGKRKRAERNVEAAWQLAPHPALARLYLALGESDEPIRRLMRMQALAKLRPEHPESSLALAEAAIAARLWGEARRALAALPGDGAQGESARACRLKAALEEGEHGDGARAREWLRHAAGGEPDAAWLCRNCGAAEAEWQALCPRCAAYDALAWESPARAAPSSLVPPPAAAAGRSGVSSLSG